MQLADIPRSVTRHEAREPHDTLSDAARAVLADAEAQERLLADTDTYADWLYSHCANVPRQHTRIGYVPRDDVRRMQYIESCEVAQLVALTLQPNKTVAGEACWELRNRYLAAQGDYLAKLAAEVVVA